MVRIWDTITTDSPTRIVCNWTLLISLRIRYVFTDAQTLF